MLKCCACLLLAGCAAHRTEDATRRCESLRDSSKTAISAQTLAVAATDSLELRVVELTTSVAADSIQALTMKVVRLSRQVEREALRNDSAVQSMAVKTREENQETRQTETTTSSYFQQIALALLALVALSLLQNSKTH